MSAFELVDQAVRDEIATNLGENLCVEAGAGTGKTTVLVRRVVELLAGGRAGVDGLAVITFTEAAAAELAARVREGLEGALDTAGGERRARIEEALNGLHRARVETIHAFAANLLRERPVEAGLDPGFEVLDDLATRLELDAAYHAWLDGLLQEDHPELLCCLNRGFDLRELRKLVDALHAHRYLLPLRPWVARAPDMPGFLEHLRRIEAELAELLPLAQRDPRAAPQMERILAFARGVREASNSPAWLERVLLFEAPGIRKNAGAQGNWDDPDDCRRTKTLFSEVRDALEQLAHDLRTEALLGVLPLAESFVAGYERARREKGVADFDDLLVWSRNLLVESPEARSAFRRRFQAILVDEFQDTDPLQAEIALLIASDGEPADWLELQPAPGRLVVVGDPKQSIYRFRRADIAVYDAVKRGPLRDGVRQLSQNFRAVPGVLRFVNDVFDRALVELPGVQPANVALVPGDAQLADESRCIVAVHGTAGERAEETYAEEARLAAATIRRAIADGWPVRDPATEEERPVRYGDVVCLYRTRTALPQLEQALVDHGVPYRVEGSRSFFHRQEVRDLAHVLRAIDDPTDRLSLFGSLRSPAFSCSEEDVYLWTVTAGRLDYRHVPDEGPEPMRSALLELRDLHRLRENVSLAELVRETIRRTGLVEAALDAPGGAQAAANLLKLAERARAFSVAGGGGLRDFAHWLSESEASEVEEAEAGVADESAQVVRLMTVHAAKGLEFPVVALTGLAQRPRSVSGPIPDGAGRLHLRITVNSGTSWEARFETPGYEAAQTGESLQEDAELRRILYVAATRARDRLIVPIVSAGDDHDGPLLAELLPSLPAHDPERVETEAGGCYVLDPARLPGLVEEPEHEPAVVVAAEAEAARAERERWTEERAALLARARLELVIEPASAREGPEPHVALLAAEDAPLILGEGPPREVGEALHRVMELCDPADAASLPPLVAAVCSVAGIPEAQDEVLELARACLASPIVARAVASGHLWREVPYTLPFEAGYRTGRVDLVFREPDGLVVIDWKTEAVGPGGVDAAVEEHRPQAQAYAEALAAATGLAVKEAVLMFPRASEERRLDDAVARYRSGPFPQTT